MQFNQPAGDEQSQADAFQRFILTGRGVKPIEDVRALGFGHARAFILHAETYKPRVLNCRHVYDASFGRELGCIAQQIFQDAIQPRRICPDVRDILGRFFPPNQAFAGQQRLEVFMSHVDGLAH